MKYTRAQNQASNQRRYDKRVARRAHAIKVLCARHVSFVRIQGDAHLMVEGRIDYFPGTGLYYIEGTEIRGRGLLPLLHLLEGMKDIH